jgi:flagellar rod assembly protein/muramidase FlgJ
MKAFARFCSAAALCMAASFEVHALEAATDSTESIAHALNNVAEDAMRPPLPLAVSEHLTWPQPGKVAAVWPPASRKEFLAAIWPHAERCAKLIGVTPHALAAQAALESGWGRRIAKDSHGQPTFNLFGIKAGPNWTGDRIEVATHEYIRGVKRSKVADFRAYESIAEAFDDYVSMLKANSRYASALKHGGPSRHFAARLQRAGYSTDPHYARKIHSIANSHIVRGHKPRKARRTAISTKAGSGTE